MSAKALKLGILMDEERYARPDFLLNAMRLKIDQVNAAGGIDGRNVELVVEISNGAHGGLPENLGASYRALLADPEVIGIVGPGVSDNCFVLVDEVARARIPTLCWPGSEDCRGEWYFQYQIGSFADETLFLARGMRAAGHVRIGVLQVGTTGAHYYRHFEREARLLGLTVAGKTYANVHESDVTAQLTELRQGAPDAIVFLGMGEPTLAFARGVHAIGWDVPRYSNIAMLPLGAMSEDELHRYEGVMWVDQYEPRNITLQAFEAKYRAAYGDAPIRTPLPAAGWDMMTLMTEGLKRASNFSRAGLKDGLENVKQVPAAMGGLAPTMGFCKWDRQAIKGPDIMMYRRVRGGRAESFVPGAD